MNLGEARSKVADLRARHIDSDATYIDAFRRSVVAPALKQLASDVPEAFIPDEEVVVVYEDYTHESLGRTLAATTDALVLSLGLVALPGGAAIETNGTWDGIYHLEITHPVTGEIVRRRCREFFTASDPLFGSTYYVSIDRPWRNSSDTGLKFRLYQPYFYTRDDVTEIVDGRVFDANRQPIFPVPAGLVRLIAQEDYNGTVTGPPRRLSRWGHEQIPAPNKRPVATAPNQDPPVPWLGPEPPGSFVYCVTYRWGRRDRDLRAPGGSFDPMLESSPGPKSATVVMPSASNAVVVTNLANIDYVQGFDPVPAQLRNGHSGWSTRIYRARLAIVTTPGMVNAVEAPEDVFFFLDEVDGIVTSYTDNGSVTPDYNRRLPESHGYFKWVLHPHPTERTTVDLRVYRRPLPLLDDSDAPQVHPDFEDLLLLLFLKYAAMLDKQPAEAADYQNQFLSALDKWRAKDANPSTVVIPIPWSMDDCWDWNRYAPFRSV
jgi:hypothetical protein